jgi:hypothetical protein
MKPLLTFVAAAALAMPVSAAPVLFYTGLDSLTALTNGPYVGLPNPNAGRLTLLLNHGDHFHAIGAYSYSGSAAAPVVNSTSSNNRLPEPSSGEPPLPFSAGTGLYGGKLVIKRALLNTATSTSLLLMNSRALPLTRQNIHS